MNTKLLAPLSAAALASVAMSQGTLCLPDVHPLHIVDANGVDLPTTPDGYGGTISQVSTESIYVAFDPSTPTGTYYVHVTDGIDGLMDEVVSANDPMDRFVHVENNNGVITLSLPFTADANAITYGVGINGGQSLLLNQLNAPQYDTCNFLLQYSSLWDLTYGPEDPYLLKSGLDPNTGSCAIFGSQQFHIGDGDGSDVIGSVYDDDNRNGVRDAGEVGVADLTVKLLATGVEHVTTTDADGNYRFDNVGKNDWTVELTVPSAFVATTASSEALIVCDCASVGANPIGIDEQILPCDAKPKSYWRSWQGSAEAEMLGVFGTLPALGLVNTWGCPVAPSSKWQFRSYLRWSWSWNMAYSLSGQLASMNANVVSGRVHIECVVNDPQLGVMTVGQLMQQASLAIMQNTYTPPCSGSARQEQRRLRNALRRANRNEIWQ